MKSDTMVSTLIDRALECASASLQKYAEGNLDRFGMEGGVALELLCKAYLARIDPSLIIDTTNRDKTFDYLLLARGHPGAAVPRSALRTIGADEALRRVAQLVPAASSSPRELSPLIESRNGFLHLGEVDRDTAKSVCSRYVATMRTIGAELGLDVATLFADYADYAEEILKASAEDVSAYVTAAIATAHKRFEEQFLHVPKATVASLVTTLEQSVSLSRYEQEYVECPSCGHRAVASGDYEVGDPEPDSYDREGNPEGFYLPVTLHASALACPVCGLAFAAYEELEAAGVETVIAIEDVDPADFYEPDYDDYRD